MADRCMDMASLRRKEAAAFATLAARQAEDAGRAHAAAEAASGRPLAALLSQEATPGFAALEMRKALAAQDWAHSMQGLADRSAQLSRRAAAGVAPTQALAEQAGREAGAALHAYLTAALTRVSQHRCRQMLWMVEQRRLQGLQPQLGDVAWPGSPPRSPPSWTGTPSPGPASPSTSAASSSQGRGSRPNPPAQGPAQLAPEHSQQRWQAAVPQLEQAAGRPRGGMHGRLAPVVAPRRQFWPAPPPVAAAMAPAAPQRAQQRARLAVSSSDELSGWGSEEERAEGPLSDGGSPAWQRGDVTSAQAEEALPSPAGGGAEAVAAEGRRGAVQRKPEEAAGGSGAAQGQARGRITGVPHQQGSPPEWVVPPAQPQRTNHTATAALKLLSTQRLVLPPRQEQNRPYQRREWWEPDRPLWQEQGWLYPPQKWWERGPRLWQEEAQRPVASQWPQIDSPALLHLWQSKASTPVAHLAEAGAAGKENDAGASWRQGGVGRERAAMTPALGCEQVPATGFLSAAVEQDMPVPTVQSSRWVADSRCQLPAASLPTSSNGYRPG